MDYLGSLKLEVTKTNMLITIGMFVVLFAGFVIINLVSSSMVNNAFGQSGNMTSDNGNSNSNNSLTNTVNQQGQQQQQQQQLFSPFPANFTRSQGAISSIQNNEFGVPTWILNGQWDLGIPKALKINQTNPPNSATFNAAFEMIKTDGTSRHMHMISDFKLNGSYIKDNDLTLKGTATVSMKDGPIKNVPVSITVLNQGALSIFVDPIKTKNHFGNTLIYGTVSAVGVFLTLPNK